MATGVLIVDDDVAFRGLARLLLEAEGFDVIGEAEDGASAISAVRALRPAVVLLDVQLPDIDGFDVARTLAAESAPPVVVLISSRDRTSYRHRLSASAALGFVCKSDLTGAALAALIG